MRDVGSFLVPEGNATLPAAQHARFIDHLADLSVTFWEWQDTIGGLTTMAERFRFFDTANIMPELAIAEPPDVIVAAEKGWRALIERAPLLADIARAVQEDPKILTEPLAATPVTFLHGDWKLGNLGSHPDADARFCWIGPIQGPVRRAGTCAGISR